MAAYQYDETGQFGFVIVAFLAIILLPWSYITLKSLTAATTATKTAPPCAGWLDKDESIKRSTNGRQGAQKPLPWKTLILLSTGWLVLAYYGQRVAKIGPNAAIYDPFAILGISTSLGEKEIKRHYKRMTLKFHPDKIKLSENQTKEQADEHFVNITKAYKALTDETIRKNFELYGHPDGKQEFSMGIALPKWVVESHNSGYVIGIYALLFGIALPYFVGRWWYGSRKYTKDQILNSTAATVFTNLKEDSSFSDLLELLASSDEFNGLKQTDSGEYSNVETQIRVLLKARGRDLSSNALLRKTRAMRAAVLLYAHLFRVSIKDAKLLQERNETVLLAHQLTTALSNVATAYSWLHTLSLVISVQQRLMQAIHPTLPSLLQAPGLTISGAEAAARAGIRTMKDLALAGDKGKEVLKDLEPRDAQRAIAIAQHWPYLEIESAQFKVTGEKVITPGCIVALVLKLRLVYPHKPSENDVEKVSTQGQMTETVKEGEMEINELIGRKAKGADGEEPTPFACAPLFPRHRKPTWSVFVGDQKLAKIFVLPARYTDIGANSTRTIRHTFQAPPAAGMFTFQAYVKSDSYIGTDVQKDMKMEVIPFEALDDLDDADDDISEPDEDTFAGQMAQMKGKPVKRIPAAQDDDDDDDTSDDSSDDSDDSSDSSDSSDSD
ncbi:uncharacterized protein L969DRAFT_85663 [Mixia osmundae IAM 14324]|uniref:J domain-containing protein n=1 Tax=Mixia osmundae (strain CBS 9802 / IAM 14324 / JCM 22182 / KY 12970) TaxID=764103 RepID=G7E688_MIXOS|nr:uncharacterized protein L969DRAFT_85663 [Mixia osmundae IAM 14324]KEI40497.1 hypothetical protein L969DRAFT_85663 [Mixia osmundae IAM 14324]GAA98348.1 hypothetical protein E5Q_05034 [Mixia osmundae IAM 14324]